MSNDFKKRLTLYLNIFHRVFQRDTWRYITPCDVLLVGHDNSRGYIFHGKAYSHLLDSFGELCIRRGLIVSSIAKEGSRLIGEKAYNSPVSYDQSYLLTAISGEIIKKIRGVDIGRAWVESHQVKLWCRILEKAQPICVIGIQPEEHLCQAGKLKKIPVYDLQHGVIADENPWYGEAYRVGSSIEKLPNGFLCWDKQSVETISKWAHNKKIRIIEVGNPWFSRFIRVDPDDLLVKETLADREKIVSNRPCIVVSLQWGLAMVYPDRSCNGVMVEALENVIRDTMEQYNWIIRLHPVQLRGEEREMVVNYLMATFGAEKTKRWIMTSEIPLPVVLSKADLHITDSSTVVVESAWMGVRSGLLNEQLNPGGKYQSYFSYERNLGMAEVIPQNPDIIKKWIVDTIAKGHGASTLNGSGDNMESFIDEIVRVN